MAFGDDPGMWASIPKREILLILGLLAFSYYMGWLSIFGVIFRKVPEEIQPVEKIMETLKDVEDGKAIDLIDLLSQLRYHCEDEYAGDCADYVAKLPKVAAAVERGPATWDGRPLKKYNARGIDRLLTSVAHSHGSDMPDTSTHLHAIAAKLLASLPKSLVKADLKFFQQHTELWGFCALRLAWSGHDVEWREQHKRVGRTIERFGRRCVVLHGGKSQDERERNLSIFKQGGVILVATDVAGRGLDISNIAHVINYDLPSRSIDSYAHRIGRTGRAGKDGLATSLLTDEDTGIMAPLRAYLESTGSVVPDKLARNPASQASGSTERNLIF